VKGALKEAACYTLFLSPKISENSCIILKVLSRSTTKLLQEDSHECWQLHRSSWCFCGSFTHTYTPSHAAQCAW